MPIVQFPEPPKQEPHDYPRPQSYAVNKVQAETPTYEGIIIHPAVFENTTTPKINKHIEIVMTPDGIAPGTHRNNVGITLDAPTILEVLSRRYEKVCVSVIKKGDDLKGLIAKKPDLVFSGIKYFDFNDQDNEQQKNIWFADYLAEHNLAYIGSTTRAYRKSYDKIHAKKIVQDAGIKTAQFFTTQPDELIGIAQSLPIAFPLFVKPDEGGDSRGIDANSIVTDFEGLKSKVLDIYRNQQRRSLVETYLLGKEYSVGVFEDIASGKLTAMPIEIIPEKNKNGDRILDFDAKKDDTEQVIEVKDLRIHKLISDLAIQVFKALKARSHARIDIKMDEYGVPHFLEANLMPGLAKGYFYRSCALNQKMSYEQMIYKITDNALVQHRSCV